MNVAVRTPPPRRQAPRPPRAPANDLRSVLRQQLPLLLACAAVLLICVFAVAAANANPALA